MHGAGRCFCAGADISQFGGESQERVDLGRRPTDMLGFEELEMPVVAAIHGYALGGGLEAALGTHPVLQEELSTSLAVFTACWVPFFNENFKRHRARCVQRCRPPRAAGSHGQQKITVATPPPHW